MIARTTTRETNSLERDTALEALLLDDLLDLLDDPGGSDVNHWLVAILEALIRILPRELRSKESEGYLHVVLEEYPNWDRQVQELHEQHAWLLNELQELRSNAARLGSRNRIPLHVRRRLIEWVGLLTEHNHRETEMVQLAVNLEVGIGD